MPKTINRRVVVKNAICGTALSIVFPWQARAGNSGGASCPSYFAGGYKVGGFTPPRKTLGDNYIAVVEASTNNCKLIKVKPDVHSVAVNPKNPYQIFGLAKEQPFSSVIDIREPKQSRTFNTLTGNLASGHGVVTADGNFLLSSEQFDETQEGFIVIRRTDNLSVTEKFGSFGKYPHEMHFTNDGKTLVVANGGKGDVSLAYIDFEKRTLLERYFPPEPTQLIRHFQLGGNDSFLVGGWPEDTYASTADSLAAIVFAGHRNSKASKAQKIDLPADLSTGQMKPIQYLSVAANLSRQQFGVTCEDNGSVTFFDMKSLKYIGHLKMHHPKGIVATSDGSEYVVSDSYGSLHFIDSASLQLKPSKMILEAKINNSHMTAWFSA